MEYSQEFGQGYNQSIEQINLVMSREIEIGE